MVKRVEPPRDPEIIKARRQRLSFIRRRVQDLTGNTKAVYLEVKKL
jgi:hypothetical protein